MVMNEIWAVAGGCVGQPYNFRTAALPPSFEDHEIISMA